MESFKEKLQLIIFFIMLLSLITIWKCGLLWAEHDKEIYYLNKKWPARQAPVQIESQVGPYFYYGLGNCYNGIIYFSGKQQVEATLKIDLRTVDFHGHEWPKRDILHVYEDPWMFIHTHGPQDAMTVRVTWRGKTWSYPALSILERVPPNTLGKGGPPVENLAYSLEFKLDLTRHGIQSDSWFSQFTQEKIAWLRGKKQVLRKMHLKKFIPQHLNFNIHAGFSPEQRSSQDKKHNIADTKNIELLGNPFLNKYKDGSRAYARNIWDMQVFNGRIYLGHGNSNNNGPVPNAGPIDVWYWDHKEARFVKEFVVDDEQIGRYRIIAERLFIPGHDPRESWELGNFYTFESKNWNKIRSIPNGIHNYDMIGFNGDLFAAIGTERGASVVRSKDDGKSWDNFSLPKGRAFTLFSLNGKLFVCTLPNAIYEYEDKGFHKINIDLFPDTRPSHNTLVVRPSPFNEKLLYIGANISIDHQWYPFGLYTAESIERSEKVKLPEGDAPYDIVVSKAYCFVLINSAPEFVNGKKNYWVKVLRSKDLKYWEEVVRFESKTFARSFEILEGDLYFGLGSLSPEVQPETGDILRISRSFLNISND